MKSYRKELIFEIPARRALVNITDEVEKCVAESGIATADQCVEVARAGYGSALVGGSLMSEADPVAAIRAMLAAGREAARFAA